MCWITGKARQFHKNIYFCFIDYAKPLTVWITTNCGKIFKRWEYQTTWPASWEMYAGQEATDRTGNGATDWFWIGKGVCQGGVLSPWFSSVQFNHSVMSDSFDPMNCSMPSLVHHQLPEFTQTHVHQVGDAIQPFHPLSFPLLLPPIPPSIRVFSNESTLHMRWPKYWSWASTSVLPMNTQDWFPLGWTGWISLQSKGLSRVLSNTIVQMHQFFSAQLSL